MKKHELQPLGACIVVLLLMICFSKVTFGQTGTLKGRVIDAKSGAALPGANIVVTSEDTNTGTASNLSGEYAITNLPPALYTVTVTYIGYLKDVRSVVLFTSETKSIDIQLTPTPVEFDPIVVTVSRRPEKVLEAPAAVSIVTRSEIAARPVLNLLEHVNGLPALDIINTGLNSSRVVVRGFSDSFSGRLLTLTDNRIANVPSLRVNVAQLIPTANEDIERIEVIEGPASALYGPNAAGGVIHVITKSPFDSKGTQVSSAVGERNVFSNSLRHAGTLGDQFGYKISFQYDRGTDWKFFDPTEPDSIIKGIQTSTGRVDLGEKIANERDFDIEKISADVRFDIRSKRDFRVILSGGFSRISNIEITGQTAGTFQLIDWSTSYIQSRLNYKNVFAQAFYNRSNSGDTFSLGNGDLILDKSTLFVAQVQHGFTILNDRQYFTYGGDLLLTRPDTKNTLNGRNENKDDINEIGFYLQSETNLSSKLRLVAAARIDDQNHLPNPVFSPRTALVFKPNVRHNFRVTFNRAYESPATQSLFLDINLAPSLGGLPYSVRFRGVPPETGYHFMRDESGGIDGLYMQSPFNPENLGGRAAFIPADATLMWNTVVVLLQQEGIDISMIRPPGSGDVQTALRKLNTTTGKFDPFETRNVLDIPPLKPSSTTTLEFGYKGVLNNQLLLVTNLYYENNTNFYRSFGTPNVFFDTISLTTYLRNFMPLPNAAALADTIGQIPVGTISPEEGDPADILLTTRNFGDVSHYGAELGLTLYLNTNWTLGGNYSYLSNNLFTANQNQPGDIFLGAPKHKIGVRVEYKKPEWGLNSQLRVRYVDSFLVTTSQLVESYCIFDLNASWKLPFYESLDISLSVQNLFNNKHREYHSVPEIGRLGILRLTYFL